MALDIVAQDIIIDETTGIQVEDDDVNPLDSPHSTDPTLLYLLSLNDTGGLTSPEVAFKEDFVVASASAGETITSVVLAQNSSGTPFSTTVGVNSGIQTVDGNYVWLFQDPTDPNVVIGVIGTSDPTVEPAETGPLAFSFALIPTSATNADLYTVEYVPLLHPNVNNPDDRIDLTDQVFASVTGTSVVNFSQLGDAPPGHNNWYILDADAASPQKILVTAHDNGVQSEVNISTQGLGVASQDVRFGRELQIDLISGGTQSAGKNFTNTPTAPDYDTHIENVSGAGFSVSQSTPTNTVADIEIHAYNNNDNAEGANFPGDDNDAEINITGVTFKLNGVATTAAALGITVDLSGNGLILQDVGEGVTVDFTTAGGAGGTFDRFTIKNIDTEKDYFDVKEVHFSGAVANAHNEEVGSFINFDDDGPSITAIGVPPELTVDESNLSVDDSADFSTFFSSNAGADGDAISYALGISQGTNDSGLTDTATGQSVLLFVEGGNVVGRAGSAAGPIVFTVSVSAAGVVSLDQARAVVHADINNPDDSRTLAAADLVTLTATITDKDGDDESATLNIGQNLNFEDDGPTITKPFDGDQNAGNGNGTHETLANTLNASATGAFGYDIGADAHTAAFYTGGGSDFVDQNGALAGVQIGLSGTIIGGGGGNVLTPNVTLASESLTSATFNFTFTYDRDPAAGVQTGTAGGTLVFDKVADTYTINLTDPLEGFSFDVIHTSELLSKEPTSNTGHPPIVVERLQADDPNTPDDEDFYVQFTGNAINNANPSFSLTNNGEGSSADSTFNGVPPHEMVSNNNETWVSATQSTNGVAGDTIQKGELLTLRFFNSNVGIAAEATTPTATAGTMAIKFDGIGNSEDLMLILDLIDKNGADNIAGTADDNSTITRAVYVSNADIFKTGQVPAPYSSEFTLDNNDGLVIIEQNDYNAAGEDYVMQGAQIMQSGNGITGTAIDLTRATGAGGGSNATTNLVAFDATDNDVLKITDIGFTTTVTQTPDANLDFAFQVEDADADQTAIQHILVDVA
ncbi:MAG: hypothetical protein EOQ45_00930 [Mesorhizobium sp.]|uniref:DUF5801 repeats-in-toxin domain-containing protein n=1 Tax=Mesorhizobium sp. TaxID=1871066 RepID=UPI000FE6719B|nr:DUF5801 repeats-in-toxin domain-containing protein [Mesorhizobium sp.]RWF97139.1 MAG: hypothetical protein EOQ45_00930 [Mesorhizobium sp.]